MALIAWCSLAVEFLFIYPLVAVRGFLSWCQEWDRMAAKKLEFEKDDPAVLLTKFQYYCEPKKNITYERHIFNTSTQQLTQSFDAFLTELRLQAKKSAYGTLTNELIRDRLVAGIRDDKVHRRLLSEPDLTPQRCTTVTHAAEISQAQMHAIKADETNNVHELRPSRAINQPTKHKS